jgi:hypothetical protein
MKYSAVISLSILHLSLAMTTSVKAESRIEHLAGVKLLVGNNTTNTETEITPFELVARAYQGAYRTQGIPGFSTFLNNSSNKKITARDLVKAAIEANQLAPETQNNLEFLRSVDNQLLGRRL